ncbi:MAG: CdaR family protein [Anaerolineae bacterium]
MMLQSIRNNRAFLDNLLWFAGSMFMAFLVWMFANFQSDPVQQRRFADIPIRLVSSEHMLVISPAVSLRRASVVIRAPSSILDLISSGEITVEGDLEGLTSGEHIIELQAELPRQQTVVADISPRLLRVSLEEASSKQVPLRAVVTGEPPAGYARETPTFDLNLNQILVNGPASRVQDVVAAQGELDLSEQRNPLETDLRLMAVDANGEVVNDVTLDPAVVHTRVEIRRRDDVREVSVRPNLEGTPPDGYVLNTISYEPQVVLVSGTPSQLQLLPETLSTQPINLTDRKNSFDVSVAVVLPDADLLLLSEQNISVSVEINPVTISRQFDEIPIEVLGLTANATAELSPSTVSVLVSGPQAELDTLKARDVRVALDLNGLLAGNYTLTPSVSLGQGQITVDSVSLLPAEVDVQIIDDTAPTSGPTEIPE